MIALEKMVTQKPLYQYLNHLAYIKSVSDVDQMIQSKFCYAVTAFISVY